MPRIKQSLIFALAKNLHAYLALDAGVGRSVPEAFGDPSGGETRRAESAPPQPPRSRLRGVEQKGEAEKRLAADLRRERERRWRAEGKLKQYEEGTVGSTVVEQAHALPEPDDSVGRQQIFRSLLSPLKPGRMLDLGAGPGHYAMTAARLGWDVTAVDARTGRTPDPETEKNSERADLVKSITWVEADVRDFPVRAGEYDLICILGLLHHLEVDDHIKLLSRCSGTLTLLNARVAPENLATEGPYEGLYHHEPGESREERDRVAAASWGNEVSFLHTEESLIRLLRDCGYIKAMPMRPPHTRNYTFYLCLPSPG